MCIYIYIYIYINIQNFIHYILYTNTNRANRVPTEDQSGTSSSGAQVSLASGALAGTVLALCSLFFWYSVGILLA